MNRMGMLRVIMGIFILISLISAMVLFDAAVIGAAITVVVLSAAIAAILMY